jgi:transcription termination factor NusB
MTPKDVIAQAEKEMREEIKNALFDYMVDYNKTLSSDDRDILIEKTADKLLSKYSSYTKDLLQSVIKEIEKYKTDERKVSVFGKGMDSWEARTYDEKKLVNAVLSDIIKEIK